MVVFLIGPLASTATPVMEQYLKAELVLRKESHSLVSPREKGLLTMSNWKKALKISAQALAECDGVALVSGWEDSRYGRSLKELADARKMPQVAYDASGLTLPPSTV
jgi:hypothetical protein